MLKEKRKKVELLICLNSYVFSSWKIVLREVWVCAHSCLTLCEPMEHSLPDSSLHGIFQAKLLEWVAISYSRRSSRPRDWIPISCVSWFGRWIFYHWATKEATLLHLMLAKRLRIQGHHNDNDGYNPKHKKYVLERMLIKGNFDRLLVSRW